MKSKSNLDDKNYDFNLIILLSDRISIERINWLENLLISLKTTRCNVKPKLFLTGSALYIFFNSKYFNRLNKIYNLYSKNFENNTLFEIDNSEARIIGLNKIKKINSEFDDHCLFWNNLIEYLKKIYNGQRILKNIGFLQLESPYFNRSSVFCVRFLQSAINNCVIPELYLYLDGVHIGLKNQNPSEFENIYLKIEKIYNKIKSLILKDNEEISEYLKFMACARCAKARGYIYKEYFDEIENKIKYISNIMINEIEIVNLNEIIQRFKQNIPIFSANSFNLINKNISLLNNSQNIEITIFITKEPYYLEYSFGGLSLAIATSNNFIKTNIIFIEDGVYNLIQNQIIHNNDKIFNIEELINSTRNEEYLKYFVFKPSLRNRNINFSKIENFKFIKLIDSNELIQILNLKDNIYLHRIFIF